MCVFLPWYTQLQKLPKMTLSLSSVIIPKTIQAKNVYMACSSTFTLFYCLKNCKNYRKKCISRYVCLIYLHHIHLQHFCFNKFLVIYA